MHHKTIRKKRCMRRSRKMGGNRIGTGRTSNVFSPPLKCKDEYKYEKYNNDRYVSKLTTSKIAEREFEKAEPLRIIDPDQRFTLIPIATCLLKDEQNNVNFRKNTNTIRGRDTLVIMPNGGITLIKLFELLEEIAYHPKRFEGRQSKIPPQTYIDEVIKSLKDLAFFIIRMNQAHIFHNDISFDNIVFNEDTIETRIIDFELGNNKIKHSRDLYDIMSIIYQIYDFKAMIYKSPIPDFFYKTIKPVNASIYTEEKLLSDLALIIT